MCASMPEGFVSTWVKESYLWLLIGTRDYDRD